MTIVCHPYAITDDVFMSLEYRGGSSYYQLYWGPETVRGEDDYLFYNRIARGDSYAHWAVTITASEITVYRSGEPVVSGSHSMADRTFDNLWIHKDISGGIRGVSANVRVYNRALSQREIQEIARVDMGGPRMPPRLAAARSA
jgi:hypothetical protein